MPDWIKLAIPVLTMIISGFVIYFARQTQKDNARLEKKHDEHEKKDDDRFEKLTIKIEAIKGNELLYEKLDALKDDSVNKRHALRAEMREASVAAYDRTEKLGEQLRAEIARLEGRLPKG